MKIKYFAKIQEQVGLREEEITPAPMTVSHLREILMQRHPQIKTILPHLRFAVNLEFVDLKHPLQENDEVALIPPVSGG
ncbi:MAG: molybdopterin converting factor subunit 1 [Planctomycetota bacterium]